MGGCGAVHRTTHVSFYSFDWHLQNFSGGCKKTGALRERRIFMAACIVCSVFSERFGSTSLEHRGRGEIALQQSVMRACASAPQTMPMRMQGQGETEQ